MWLGSWLTRPAARGTGASAVAGRAPSWTGRTASRTAGIPSRTASGTAFCRAAARSAGRSGSAGSPRAAAITTGRTARAASISTRATTPASTLLPPIVGIGRSPLETPAGSRRRDLGSRRLALSVAAILAGTSRPSRSPGSATVAAPGVAVVAASTPRRLLRTGRVVDEVVELAALLGLGRRILGAVDDHAPDLIDLVACHLERVDEARQPIASQPGGGADGLDDLRSHAGGGRGRFGRRRLRGSALPRLGRLGLAGLLGGGLGPRVLGGVARHRLGALAESLLPQVRPTGSGRAGIGLGGHRLAGLFGGSAGRITGWGGVSALRPPHLGGLAKHGARELRDRLHAPL